MPEDRTNPPTQEDLQGLPPTAIIAFAARCARRVQPLYKHSWPDAPKKHVQALDRAITLVQLSAASPDSTSSSELNAAASAATHAAHAASVASAASHAASAAAHAAHAAADADSAAFAAAAADSAAFAAFAAAHADSADLIDAMWHDLVLLKAAAERKDWQQANWSHEHGPSVPPEFFGPLWPNGAPEGYPVSEDAKNPANRTKTPTQSDLQVLPPTAIIAFAARCAHRVQPLIARFFRGIPSRDLHMVNSAIEYLQLCATTPDDASLPDYDGIFADLSLLHTRMNYEGGHAGALSAVLAAKMASKAARDASDPPNGSVSSDDLASWAASAAAAAAFAMSTIATDAASTVTAHADGASAIWHDFERLRAAAKHDNWKQENWPHNLGPPVAPDFFGPLWPNGEPEGWPSANDEANADNTERPRQGLKLRAEIAEWAPTDEVVDELINLYKALDQAHKALGGQGLSIEDWDMFCRTGVPVEVLS